MKIVTGDDGQQYIQWEGQVAIPIRDAKPETPNAAYTMESLLALKWPTNPFLPTMPGPESDAGLTMTAQMWLPGDPTPDDERSEPEHPTGRFNNLDWEEPS